MIKEDLTFESKSGKACEITGPKSVWKKGVSGTALGFDGYNTKVEYPEFKLPNMKEVSLLKHGLRRERSQFVM